MATVTVTGTVGRDPELRFTPSGVAVCQLSIADTPRKFNKQTNEWESGDTLWLRCVAWRQLGEAIAESVETGDKVHVTGKLVEKKWTGRDGVEKTSFEVSVDTFALMVTSGRPLNVSRVQRSGRPTPQRRNTAPAEDPFGGGGSHQDDPWATRAPAGRDDEDMPPF